MNIALSILLFVFGGVAVLLYQYYQSKEVLKQTLYNEKFQVFKNITSNVYKLYSVVYNYVDSGNDNDKLKAYKRLRLFQTSVQQHYFLLTDSIAKQCQRLAETSLKAIQTQKLDLKNLLSIAREIDVAIQSELGIEVLSKELKDLYEKFPALSLIKK